MSGGNYTYSEVAGFIRRADRRGLYFGGWPNSVLEIYLQWHDQNGNLVIRADKGNLVAVALVQKVLKVDHDQQPKGRGAVPMQDPMEEEEWGMEKGIDGLNHRLHWGLTVFALESVFNKDMEGVK